MIDAYEIGIQLLLQEDVSAGLAVINRALAEVDRAIAATSAQLSGLVKEADIATKAISVAVNGRAPPAAATNPKSSETTQQVAQPVVKDDGSTVPALSREGAAAPEIKTPDTAASPTPVAAQSTNLPLQSQVSATERAVPSSAPAKSVVNETVRSDKRAKAAQAGPDASIVKTPARAVPPAIGLSESAAPSVREFAAVGQAQRRDVSPSAAQVSLTASISRAQDPATAAARQQHARHQSTSGPAARRERPAAPWSGINHSVAQAETMRSQEKAAAPRQAGRNQDNVGGGTVMLDGRLVGQWLSEHMAREASRPPVGTNFFDSRQTPAWNVSGAL